MKKVLFLPLLLIACISFAQPAKPSKIGLISDFVGVLQSGGMLEGFMSFTLYCEDLQKKVTFNSGFGIKNPPKVSYGRYSDLIWDIYTFGASNGSYVLRVKAKSVYQYNDMSGRTDIVWTPTKITLISTSSTLPK
jgi:hypothetical protein